MDAILKSDSESDRRAFKEHFFYGVSILCVLAPVFGEAAFYLSLGTWSRSLLSSVVSVAFTVIIFLWHRQTRDIDRTLRWTPLVQAICYCWGLLASRGIYAEHIVILPILPVLFGFVYGRRAAIQTGVGAALFSVLLWSLAKMGVLVHPPQGEIVGLVTIQLMSAAAFTAFLVVLFENVRIFREKQLRQINAELLAEREALRQKTQEYQDGERHRAYLSKLTSAILENIPSVIFVKDCKDDFRFSLVNRSGERVMGLAARDFVGKTDFELFPFETARLNREGDLEALAQRRPVRAKEKIYESLDGKVIQTTKIPTFDVDGNPEFIIGVANDVTEDVRIREELDRERAKGIHHAKLASLGELAAGIAHEINNPLTIISGNADLLTKRFSEPPELQKRLHTIQRAVGRVAKIVSSLRRFSRSNEATVRGRYSLDHLVYEVLTLTSAKAQRESVAVKVIGKSAAFIECDEVEIEQVFINLVNNAIDAASAQSEKWVTVTLEDRPDAVVVRITDSGGGIPAAIAERLLEPFFTTKPVGQGTGLGLSIAKGILDDHGASLAVLADAPNTCFEVIFRRLPAQLERLSET